MFKKILIIIFICFLFCSCFKNQDFKGIYTNKNITKQQIQQEIGYSIFNDKFASSNYEIVNYDWLINNFYPYYQTSLFNDNVTNWNTSFECSMFCEYYISELNTLYYKDHFGLNNVSTQLAISEFWYLPNGPAREGHSILRIRTDKGWIFIDPQLSQNQQVINLTQDQINSHYLEKF